MIIDGIDRPRTNSEGAPLHDTEDGLIEFWRWFGNSRATDILGRPVVMYHGTDAEFDHFSTHFVSGNSANEFGRGFYFTSCHSAAVLYAEQHHQRGRVVAAYLAIETPRVVSTFDRGGATGWHGEYDGLIATYPDTAGSMDPRHWAEVVVASPDQIRLSATAALDWSPASNEAPQVSGASLRPLPRP